MNPIPIQLPLVRGLPPTAANTIYQITARPDGERPFRDLLGTIDLHPRYSPLMLRQRGALHVQVSYEAPEDSLPELLYHLTIHPHGNVPRGRYEQVHINYEGENR